MNSHTPSSAYRLGDDTAARRGRLTLNPLRHLDPLGSAMIFFVGFGWAKPVPVNPYNLRHGSRAGYALVAAAGPASNLFLAALVARVVAHRPVQRRILTTSCSLP